MKRALRTKSVGTKVSEAELRVLESRAAAAGLTLSEWVRDVLLGSSVEMGTLAAEPNTSPYPFLRLLGYQMAGATQHDLGRQVLSLLAT